MTDLIGSKIDRFLAEKAQEKGSSALTFDQTAGRTLSQTPGRVAHARARRHCRGISARPVGMIVRLTSLKRCLRSFVARVICSISRPCCARMIARITDGAYWCFDPCTGQAIARASEAVALFA